MILVRGKFDLGGMNLATAEHCQFELFKNYFEKFTQNTIDYSVYYWRCRQDFFISAREVIWFFGSEARIFRTWWGLFGFARWRLRWWLSAWIKCCRTNIFLKAFLNVIIGVAIQRRRVRRTISNSDPTWISEIDRICYHWCFRRKSRNSHSINICIS